MCNFRGLSLLGSVACAAGIVFALYLQHVKGLEPCPLCIFQRLAMIACGLSFLLGAVCAPGRRGMRWLCALLTILFALLGASLSGRQVWLQSLPADRVPACGPSLDYLMAIMPLRRVIAFVLKGDGSCARIDGQWLGIAMPEWTLFAFVALALLALATPFAANSRRDGK
ncbi:hypothetical protein ASG87_03730 [Frateuria sp. Soil773]|nr:hypothetical protein ASG87_03730 [Frateuria sp. Soil773]